MKKNISAKIKAHKAILMARSSKFADLFKKSDKRTYEMVDCSYLAFRIIVDFIYLDDLNIVETVKDYNQLREILELSKKYQLPILAQRCEEQFKVLIKSTINSFPYINNEKQNLTGNGIDPMADSLAQNG